MCGIAGELRRDGAPADLAAVRAMTAALAHRGPDGAGEHADGAVALGMRRLALVDLPGGAQPVRSEDGSVVAVCNGEVYGFRALRDALARRGHRLRTGSDTEVLVHLYEERGPRFVADLRGMFALALWDARRARLVLARDRFGIKPLVYALDDRRLAFASELQALLTRADVPRDVDPDAVAQFLAVNAVLAPRTMLRAVRKLPAGHLLVADRHGVRLDRFAHDRPVAAGQERSEPLADLAAELRERLRDSVRAHLDADVPVGVLLSGGVDSGAVAALAAAERGPGVPTFTVGFRERSFDELARARTVARRLRTDHHELVVGPEHAELLPAVARSFDEPRGDATALPYWLLARLASGHVKAVLSGEGGDELFGGYQTYVADRLGPCAAAAAAAVAPLVGRVPASSRRLSLDFKLRRLAGGHGLDALERHHAWKELLPAPVRAALLGDDSDDGGAGRADPLAPYRARWAESAGAATVARLQHVDVGTFLADDLLLQADRAGMAHGLEVRVPFVDPVVAELAWALPTGAKLRGLQTKRVLRAAVAPLVPPEVVRGPKRGFVPPTAAWLRGPLHGFAREVLGRATLERQGVLRPEVVAGLLDRHVARREDLGRPLWALLAFTLWHEAVLERPPAPLAPFASAT